MAAVERALEEQRDNLERYQREAKPDWEPPPEVEKSMVPYEYSFHKFRAHMGWQDAKVLGRQTIEDVEFAYRVYQLEIEMGMV